MNDLVFFGIDILQNRTLNHNDAVMFDIDDTLIYQVLGPSGNPIEPMIQLIREADNLGYKVVIITARPHYHENVEVTKHELHALNIPYDYLIFAPAEKKGIVKQQTEFNFVLSVGDMPTDLTDSEYYINTMTGKYGSNTSN